MQDPISKLNDLAGRMARHMLTHGSVDLSELTSEHGGQELRPQLAKVLEMFEVWVHLHRNGSDQEPKSFAAGFGASEEIRSAFLEAVTNWQVFASDTGGHSSAPGGEGGERDEGDGLPGQDVDGTRIVAGQSLVAVRNWIGEGGTAQVGEGTDVILNRPVAVKTPKSPNYSRLAREVELTGSFVHPNIPPVYSLAFDRSGKPAFIMPLLGGGSLTDAIDRHHLAKAAGSDAARGLYALLRHVVTAARTLHYAHTQKPAVVHRDVKPDNLLLDAAGNLYVMDWGHGYRADHVEESTPGFGTLPYAAPEQWDGTQRGIEISGDRLFLTLRNHYDVPTQARVAKALEGGRPLPEAFEEAGVKFTDLLEKAGINIAELLARPGRRADVYSLGATLYHAVTGQAPFLTNHRDDLPAHDPSRRDEQLRARKRANRYAPPEHLVAGLDPEIAGIIKKAMAAKPEDRYDTAAEFADDLERVMGRLVDEPVKAFKPGEEPFGVRVRRKIRRHAGAAALLLALFGLTGLLGLSCTAERHMALQYTQDQSAKELRGEREKSQDELRTTRDQLQRNTAAVQAKGQAELGEAKEQAAAQVQRIRDQSDGELKTERSRAAEEIRKAREQADRDLQKERDRTKAAEAEAIDLRRQVKRAEVRFLLDEQIRQAQSKPRRELTATENAAVERVARRVELELAAADAERLEIRRPASAELSKYLLRDEILRITAPEGANPSRRPTLGAVDEQILDLRGRRLLDENPQTQAARELRRRLAAVCECNAEFRGWVLDLNREPGAYNEATRLVHDTVFRMESGNLPGVEVDPVVAAEWALGRQQAMNRFLMSWLSGSNFETSLQDARATFASGTGELFNAQLIRSGDEVVRRTVSSKPSEDAILSKLINHPPTADVVFPESKPRNALPGRGPSPMDLLTQEEFAKIAGRLTQHGDGKRFAPTDFALDYRDLLPSQAQDPEKTHFHLITEEMLKAQKDLPAGLTIQMLRQVGSAEAARERAYDIEKLKGFHRVGTENGPRPSPWRAWPRPSFWPTSPSWR